MHAGKYTILGQVIDGLDTLDKMEKVPLGAPCRCAAAAKMRRRSFVQLSAYGAIRRHDAGCVILEPAGAQDRPTQEIRLNRVTVHANPIAGS